jgi:uncharacterized protein YjbI with pentapeptide repeats
MSITIKDLEGRVIYESSAAKSYLEAIREARARGLTNFSGAHLPGVDFSSPATDGVGFKQADLSRLDFSYATLSGACFSDCNLRGTDFSQADLSRANLGSTLLDGTNFYQAQLTEVIWPEPTAKVPMRRTPGNVQMKIPVSLVEDD